MSQIIPSAPIGSLPNEVLRAFRLFKSLPDDYLVWHHLTPWDKEAPDFLLIDPKKRGLLVKVSTAPAKSFQLPGQLTLIADGGPAPGIEEEAIIRAFRGKLVPGLAEKVGAVILFANIRQETLRASDAPAGHESIRWMGQEALQVGSAQLWYECFGNCLDEYALERLRMAFTPEVVIPAALTVRPLDKGRHEAGLKDYLLDSLQEAAVKNDLVLPQEQQRTSKDFHVAIVNGVVGSGKSLILLYRLRLLHALFPKKHYIVLTHNRPLIRDLQWRYKRLSGELPRNIGWETFNGFCRHHWPDDPEHPWIDPIGQFARSQILEEICQNFFGGTSISVEALESELDWFKDQIPMDKAAYLEKERRGRGFRLTRDQRLRMWDAMLEYQRRLKARKAVDWGDVPRRLWNLVKEEKVRLPSYEFIMIDEAQFFAPIWFDLILRISKPGSGHIFIAADPTQGFLRRGASWKSVGFDVRGKTQHIRRSYRTTHQILNFATLLYRRRISADDGDEDVVEPDLMNMPNGLVPVLVSVRSAQDEIGRVGAEIEALQKRGYPLGNLLVLHAEWEGVNAILASLNKRLGQGKAIDPKDDPPGDCVRVTTINAGTGLESPVVFLVGLNSMFEREQSLRLAAEEADRLILDNTRKVYMAATRAGQMLVILYVGPIPEILKDLLDIRS